MSKNGPAYGPRKVLKSFQEVPNLEFGKCIGHGYFSHVYKAIYKKENIAAVKVVERGSKKLINNEIKLLKELNGSPHIVQLYEVIEKDQTLLVFEFLRSIKTSRIIRHLTLCRLKFMIRSVLEGLASAHALGIVHRDIKIDNINISPHFKDVKLLDWGCGTHVTKSMSPKAGSLCCRSPEMLLGFKDYGTSSDIWAVGLLIIHLLSGGKFPPWKCRTSAAALKKMSHFFGGDNLRNIARKLNIEERQEWDSEWVQTPDLEIESLFSPKHRNLQDPNLVDLMYKMINLDYSQRISASEALKHPFFKKK
ncbi:CMGC family protein kinase [Histomonas meleagridis]|uniref:CMGC family protein kinase n=1 Tax=Histomonas meleagridis TaxID=135588 RepID=UPI003559F898|nr:CMGC family protein kinase [Histomonas meleagridis]KAH0806872.1 CMGC family protein kinase [Histomonas meleagridis]